MASFRYIFSQIFGAYVACLIVYLQWKPTLLVSSHPMSIERAGANLVVTLRQEVEAALEAAGKLDAILFTPSGPAGIFALYVAPGANLGNVFANELFSVSCP